MVFIVHPLCDVATSKALLAELKPDITGTTVGAAVFVDSALTWDELRAKVGTRGIVGRVDRADDIVQYTKKVKAVPAEKKETV